MLQTRDLHLALIGDMIEPLRLLLADVLDDSGLRYALTTLPGHCDVALTMVSWGEELSVIEHARALARDSPLLAILPFGDDGLAQRVRLAGVQGWFSLDTPLALLRGTLLRLTGAGRGVSDK